LYQVDILENKMSDITNILAKAVASGDLSKIARLFATSGRKSNLLSCRDSSGNELIHLGILL
jgi:hypothetical protein